MIGSIPCLSQAGGLVVSEMDRWVPTLSPPRTPPPSPAVKAATVRRSCRRALSLSTPSPEVDRWVGQSGLVSKFINIAPHLLQDGRCAAPPQHTPRMDWWAQLAEAELVRGRSAHRMRVAADDARVGSASPLCRPGSLGRVLPRYPSCPPVSPLGGSLSVSVPHEFAGAAASGRYVAALPDQPRSLLEEIEDEVCLPLCTPVLHSRLRLRRS